MHICGRRAWDIEETYDEFTHLWSRSKSGKSGQFTSELLEPKPPPNLRVKPITTSTNKRPKISDLHEALLKSDGQGWRPAQNLRVALMHFFAGEMITTNSLSKLSVSLRNNLAPKKKVAKLTGFEARPQALE